jgi:hypothetical protein
MHQEDSGNYATDAGNEPELSCFVKLTGFEQTDELRPATNFAQRRASPGGRAIVAGGFSRRWAGFIEPFARRANEALVRPPGGKFLLARRVRCADR